MEKKYYFVLYSTPTYSIEYMTVEEAHGSQYFIVHKPHETFSEAREEALNYARADRDQIRSNIEELYKLTAKEVRGD